MTTRLTPHGSLTVPTRLTPHGSKPPIFMDVTSEIGRRSRGRRLLPALDYAEQIISANLTVSQYLRQKIRAEGFAGMDRNYRCLTIGVLEESVTAAFSDYLKTQGGQGGNEL
jgi:hypothetical protein